MLRDAIVNSLPHKTKHQSADDDNLLNVFQRYANEPQACPKLQQVVHTTGVLNSTVTLHYTVMTWSMHSDPCTRRTLERFHGLTSSSDDDIAHPCR